MNKALVEPDFKALFEQGPSLQVALDVHWNIVAASDAYLQATRTRRADILGRCIFDVFPDNPGDPASDGIRNTRASLLHVQQTRAPDAMVVQRHDIRKPESEGGGFDVRYWSPINAPVLSPDGSVVHLIHRIENVTDFVLLKQQGVEQAMQTEALRERALQTEAQLYARSREVAEASLKLKQANEELARLYEKTRELDVVKSQLFANVSHELRTPLTLILGPARAMSSAANLTAEQRHDLGVVERNARTLLHTVNDLLDLSKVDAGRMEPDFARVDLSRLGRWVASHFDAVAEERDIRFAVDLPPSLPAQADPEKLQRVLFNLLSNAFKFTASGGAVRLSLRSDGDVAEILVDDDGPGVPEEMQQAIFERFRQVDSSTTRSVGGTGLGLSIVKEFVALHGGSVGVTDAPGGGARFRVSIPLRAPAGVEVRAPGGPDEELALTAVSDLRRSPRRAVEEPAPARAGAVLVVEDNAEMNAFLARTLGARHRVFTAFDGSEGLEKARSLRPDLIVSDLMMPVMSGEQMVEAIRSDPGMDDVPILLLTAKADEGTRVEQLRGGAQDYLLKPFVAEELLARADGLIDRKWRSDRQLRESHALLQQLHAELEERVEQRTADLAAANRELEAFVHTVSHDLQAPLRHVTSFARLLEQRSGAALDARSHEYLDQISGAGARMGSLITDLLALSRLGRAPMAERRVDLARLVEEVLAELEPQMHERTIDVRIDPLPIVRGDVTLLRSALLNLMSNAVKYTRTRERARVEVGWSQADDGGLVFHVRDNGVGFDPRYRERLFSLFQRLHPAEKFEGTGVGLACVRRAVERHGGRVWAESEVDRGATFHFSLPKERLMAVDRSSTVGGMQSGPSSP